jgi:nitroreductase
MTIHEALDWRYAVREFSSRKLSEEQVKDLMEATRKSASSYGLQPYKILLIASHVLREALLPYSFGQNKVAESSHLVIFAAHKEIGDETVDQFIQQLIKVRKIRYDAIACYAEHMKQALAAKTAPEKREWAHQQAYIALGTFLTAAAMMRIDSCPMTGIDRQAYDKVLGLSDLGLETAVIAVIGYRSPSDQSAKLAKVRFDYDDVIVRLD